jgi:hypothetical protein
VTGLKIKQSETETLTFFEVLLNPNGFQIKHEKLYSLLIDSKQKWTELFSKSLWRQTSKIVKFKKNIFFLHF